MIAILKKELSSYFHSPRGYIFLAISTFSIAALSFVFNFNYGSTKIEVVVSYLSLVFALLSPAIFGNCFSKERAEKTEKLLFSLPLETSDIVFGKYLSVLCLFGIELCFLIILPLIYSAFSTVNILSAYASLFGLALMCAALIAIIFFITSAFKKSTHALIASYLAVAFLVGLSIIPTVRTPEFLYVLTSVAYKFAFFARLDNFIMGAFDLETIIYYLSVTAIFLLLTLRNIEKRRAAVLSGGSL